MVDEDGRRQPAAGPASMSRQRSPTMTLRGEIVCGGRVDEQCPGFGLRHAQSSASSWEQTRTSSSGSTARQPARASASTRGARLVAARDVGLVGDDDQRIAGRFERASAPATLGKDLELRRRAPADTACRRATTARLITPSRSRKTARPAFAVVSISHLVGRALELRVRHQQVPDDRLERLGVRRDRCRG